MATHLIYTIENIVLHLFDLNIVIFKINSCHVYFAFYSSTNITLYYLKDNNYNLHVLIVHFSRRLSAEKVISRIQTELNFL